MERKKKSVLVTSDPLPICMGQCFTLVSKKYSNKIRKINSTRVSDTIPAHAGGHPVRLLPPPSWAALRVWALLCLWFIVFFLFLYWSSAWVQQSSHRSWAMSKGWDFDIANADEYSLNLKCQNTLRYQSAQVPTKIYSKVNVIVIVPGLFSEVK